MRDLDWLCNYLENRTEIRGVTFRGRGGYFCAGGDLKAFKAIAAGNMSHDDIVAMSAQAGRVFNRIEQLPQVTVMLVEGGASAGGIGLMAAGDVVIAQHDARFALSEVRLGLVAAQIAPIIMKRTGIAATRRLMVTASPFSGEEAVILGIADYGGQDAAVLEQQESEIRGAVLACAPGAIAESKALIAAIEGKARGEQVDIAAQSFAGRILSREGGEGLAAFAARRKPTWANSKSGQAD